MKKCPYCAEDIQEHAVKCKHCGSMLNAPPVQMSPPSHQGRLPDQVAHGLRRKEIQDMEYHMKVASWLILATFVGWIVGASAGTRSGWTVFLLILLGGGVRTARKYYG